LLKCVALDITPEYNLGAILARSMSLACSRNESSSIYYGGITSLVREYLKDTRLFVGRDPTDVANGTKYLDASTLEHLEMLLYHSSGAYLYRFMTRRGNFMVVAPPRKWKATDDEITAGFYIAA
jgi:hypothetical protein